MFTTVTEKIACFSPVNVNRHWVWGRVWLSSPQPSVQEIYTGIHMCVYNPILIIN